MTEQSREYRTGQGVPKTGNYLCQSGEMSTLKKDESFPSCPVSGKETYWKHEEQ
ncbi:hypothetical protein [Sediminibacillus massiliensis]|uniref:hypothetical protein n=1 Tax=Sediminibacillus massiliensis TaxID=1926277 RepID=UPI0015C3D205|nr:hypothetical protein [Sediminibacillus massiliensis]